MKIITILIQSYLTTAIGLVISVISARALSVSDRGDLAVLLLFSQASSRIVTFGFEQIIYNEGLNKETYNQMLLFVARALVIFPIILLFVSHTLSVSILNGLFIFISIFAVSILRINIAGSVYSGQLRELSIINISQVIVNLLFYTLIYYFRAATKDVFFAAWVLTITVFAFVSHGIVRKLDNSNNVLALNSHSLLKKGISYAHIVVPELMLSFCIELIGIKIVLGSFVAGLYAVTNTVGGLYFQIFSTIYSVVSRTKHINQKFLLYTFLAVIGIAIVFIGPIVIPFIFGNKYSGADSILPWIIFSSGMLGFSRLNQVGKIVKNTNFSFIPPLILLLWVIILPFFTPTQFVIPFISISYVLYSLIIFLLNRFYIKSIKEKLDTTI